MGRIIRSSFKETVADSSSRITMMPSSGSAVDPSDWQSVEGMLGIESTARFVGTSVSSTRHYSAGIRPTPDSVAARLHFLVVVLGHLAGAYDNVGVRRWFHRSRKLLNANTPAQLLCTDWAPGDDGPRQVCELAAACGPSPVEIEEGHRAGYRKDPPKRQEFWIPEGDRAWGDSARKDE